MIGHAVLAFLAGFLLGLMVKIGREPEGKLTRKR